MSEMQTTGSTGGAVAASAGVLETVVTYVIIRTQIAIAGMRLRGLSQQMRGTYRYVEGCSESVDRLAEQMSGLQVDVDTVGEHHQAATVMRLVLGKAEAMASATEDLSTLFGLTAAAHEADYGTVADAARSMPVPMADAEFYSNR